MKIIKRGCIIYYIKDEAVVAGINSMQYIGYNVYPLQNRKPFYDFRKAILHSAEHELGSPVELIRLAQVYKLIGAAAHKPNIEQANNENSIPR